MFSICRTFEEWQDFRDFNFVSHLQKLRELFLVSALALPRCITPGIPSEDGDRSCVGALAEARKRNTNLKGWKWNE
jgi:hypothetical protein